MTKIHTQRFSRYRKLTLDVVLSLVTVVVIMFSLDVVLQASRDEQQIHEADLFALTQTMPPESRARFLQGEPALVYFWATWCGVCTVTSPAVNAINTDRVVVSVSMQSGSDHRVNNWLSEKAYTFPNYNDIEGALSARLDISVTPSYLIIDHTGTILWFARGPAVAPMLEARMQLATLRQ